MRILIASDLYPPGINGVATFSENLAHEMATRGHEVMVIAPSTTRKSHREHDGKVTLHRISSLPFKLYPIRFSPLPLDGIHDTFQAFKPDIVHVQSLLEIGRNTILEARRRHIPVVLTHHAMPENFLENVRIMLPVSQPFKQVMRIYNGYMSDKAYAVTTPTQTAADIVRLQIDGVRAKVISNGVDTKRFTPGKADPKLRHRYNLPEGKPVVAYVGRVDGEKHIGVLLEALALVLEHQPVHGLIVGKGRQMVALRELAHELGIASHVTFTGFVSDEELPAVYRLADIFAMPSPAELQSITSLEAMASGLPVLAADAGALPELCYPDRNGELFETDDPTSLANSILRLLAEPETIAAYGKQSRAIALTHSIDKSIDQFEDLYDYLLEANRG